MSTITTMTPNLIKPLFYCRNLASKCTRTDSCSNEVKARLLLATQAVVYAIAIPMFLLLGLSTAAKAITLIDERKNVIDILKRTSICSMGSLLGIPLSLLGILSPKAGIKALNSYNFVLSALHFNRTVSDYGARII